MGVDDEIHSSRLGPLGVPHRPKRPKGYSSQLRDAIDKCAPDLTHRSDRRTHCAVRGGREEGENDPVVRGKTMRERPDRLAVNDTLFRMFRDDENG